ncbi:MAG: GPW/gp25 family protein, partial [Betaproteobacteria bacterium]|nr:GPW/gp25 family protein [Betaproteobacteria bacterium]
MTMATTDPGRIFGRGIAFPPRVGADGRVAWSEGEANVRESIRIILLTQPRERLRLPAFGAGLRSCLFEPNNPATRQRLREAIEEAISRWEPRASVEAVVVEPDPADPEAALASITYRLVATRSLERVSVSIRP